ncbi:hypothetical protein TWF706_000751 [Orbilia oligospora]|nr:hypothetical protein TWF706_000751 [Orbilia oligospora]
MASRFILGPEKIEMVTKELTLELFLQTYPVLTVFTQTFKVEDCPPDGYICWCTLCDRTFSEAEEVVTLPCGNCHVYHERCLANYATFTGNLLCPNHSCRQEYSAYENLTPRYKSLVWVAFAFVNDSDSGHSLRVAPIAASKDEFWRHYEDLPIVRPYLPWGNRERYLENPAAETPYGHNSPNYTLLEVKQGSESEELRQLYPHSSTQNLRSRRPTLSQLTHISILTSHLKSLQKETGDTVRVRIRYLLKLYLFGDITNCIFVMEDTFKHIYLQMRVGRGRLFWFGYREFLTYIGQVIAPLTHEILSEAALLNYLQEYVQEAPSSLRISDLFMMATVLHEFDETVERLIPRWERNPHIQAKVRELEAIKPYGDIVDEWYNEDQTVPILSDTLDEYEDL